VKLALPTSALLGLMEVRVGLVDGDTVMLKGRMLEMVLSGLSTNTFATDTVVRKEAAMFAVMAVLDPNVVGITVPFQTI
jgi:hypothetical protein